MLIPELLAYELQRNGWTLLNKIIRFKPNAMPSSLDSRFSNVYEPIFLFVKKESKYSYFLSLDKLRQPINNFSNTKSPEDILGFEVENSLLRGDRIKGRVLKVFNDPEGNIFAEVFWKNDQTTIELVQNFNKESKLPVELICRSCGKVIKSEIDIDAHENCERFPIPILPPKPDFSKRTELKSSNLFSSLIMQANHAGKQNYKGKFKLNPNK